MKVFGTPREIAHQVVKDWHENHFLSALNPHLEELTEAIEAALQTERERCAKIAEADLEISDAPAARRIADAIRRGKTNAD